MAITIAALATASAQAGSQTPTIIEVLSEMFESAKTPTSADHLQLDKQWICSEYYADSGDAVGENQPSYKFSSKSARAGTAKGSSVKEAALVSNSGTAAVNPLTFTRDGLLIGTSQENGKGVVQFFRMNSKKDLLVEKTVSAAKDSRGVASLADPDRDVVSYTICPASKLNSMPGTVRSIASHRCGFPGELRDLNQRIRDCGNTTRKSDTSSAVITLVARTDSGKEVWMDDTGLLIGDRRNDSMNWSDAKVACGKATETEAFLPGVNWHLPTGDELAHIGRADQSYYNKYEKKSITGNGLFAKLPNISDHFFWSSSSAGDDFAWGLVGSFGYVDFGFRNYGASVRCAGR